MANISIAPGDMGVVRLAIDLFGVGRVNPGTWLTPVWVTDLTSDEVSFAKEFFAEYGLRVLETPYAC